jgi:hypothetical protein
MHRELFDLPLEKKFSSIISLVTGKRSHWGEERGMKVSPASTPVNMGEPFINNMNFIEMIYRLACNADRPINNRIRPSFPDVDHSGNETSEQLVSYWGIFDSGNPGGNWTGM